MLMHFTILSPNTNCQKRQNKIELNCKLSRAILHFKLLIDIEVLRPLSYYLRLVFPTLHSRVSSIIRITELCLDLYIQYTHFKSPSLLIAPLRLPRNLGLSFKSSYVVQLNIEKLKFVLRIIKLIHYC
jgi:hypothetical protein